jgi:septal ring factor EnvC (AmiA/AmiB activator)
MFVRTPFIALTVLLASTLAFASCQASPDAPVAADLNSANPAVAAQAQKVQELISQVERQKAVIETEKTKLTGIEQQLDGARQNLEGIKKEVQAAP